MTNQKHQPAGIPAGGQFAPAQRAEPDLALGDASAPPLPVIPDTGYRGAHSGLPETPPADLTFADEEAVDLVVASVMDGPLSRGVVNRGRRAAFNSWHEWAYERGRQTQDVRYQEFAAGLRTGVAALFERQIYYYDPGAERFDLDEVPIYLADHALELSGSKRTSAEDREHWRLLLQHTPSGPWHRGHLLAGVTLSGADAYWGAVEDPERVVEG